ncbi:MAG: hypothetical protein COZ75_03710 [Flavobacteriaceae bacterium CG_4_8_14_3_um_filter_34_10]|nr:hypothetical protein [Flavobacteriia bacterium]OIP49763.1 MAG: hypothetical protein AUK33_09835 [Flavobacteriaceae bacterium CG2_30_34_30]PIQ19212.1 MAG: hypothetical protein COW66_02290 [Flavobacteriaceae bacterium CG18_big_fil_WC_8_21_14_2_50_34_36]PIV48553.1 MAG: hypothetical protein COS19_13440 [Flavobacteriaceae bacterium CG02_land_8_20_14_3_00_34_13]PIX10029.1 MAG: hypothetical protein COZ75_03710 [Flavobacteriaceae bacterium CG_4_8_14_3_um_filter_34_10]PIZ07663.1 MAG: hypothetical pr
MKKYLLVVPLLFAFVAVQAQRSMGNAIAEYLMQFQYDKTTKFEDVDLESLVYVGSPYADKNFIAGEIYHNNKLIAENVPLRYNALMDEMEFKTSFDEEDKNSSALVKSPEIDIKIGNKIYLFVPYHGGVEKGGYFEVLVKDSKYDLFKKYNKKYFAEQKAQTSMTKDNPARFTDNNVYYLVSDSGTFYELPSKSKAFSKIFLNKEKEIESYIKSRNLDLKNEKDVIAIVRYFNSLL